MDVMKNKKGAYCVDFVTVHHFTKFCSHICNTGDFTEGALCAPPPVLQGSKKPGINRVNTILSIAIIKCSHKCLSFIFDDQIAVVRHSRLFSALQYLDQCSTFLVSAI